MAAGVHAVQSAVVDFHAHVLESQVFERTFPQSVFGAFGAHPDAAWPEPGSRMALAHERMLNPALRLADMDKRGVDVQVLSSTTVMQYTAWAEPALQLELEARVNDSIADLCKRYPHRFVGSFTLPLRDIELAIGETRRTVKEHGFSVANLTASVDGEYLGAPAFRPLWETFDELGVIAFVHPDGVQDPWFQQYALWNSIGQSIEESKVMTSLILEGVLEDLPDLKIVMAHGGGFLPHYFGRLDRNFHNRPATAGHITKLPSEYLNAFYLDTCVYDPKVLAVLIELVGADRLLLGTDYPVGDSDPLAIVQASGATAAQIAAIAGGNAVELLGL
ncbi:MAG: amidohydrolase family protein [Actinobacteria bacterium]|nr:amidohydrolase family protein [Actinomycetota bacterium]